MATTIFLGLVLSCAFVSSTCDEERRRPSRYLIPAGYVGWVRTEYKVKDAPALPLEDGYYLHKFPASGLLKTSSDNDYGWATDEYYYYSGGGRRKLQNAVSGWGEGGMIWAGANGQSTNYVTGEKKTFQEFFVGTEQELNEWGFNTMDESSNPKIGPKEQIKPN